MKGFLIKFLGILAFTLCLSSVDAASKLNWMTNYDDAVSQAKAGKKPLLLFFTGSDWCGYCHQLENEVFSSMEFADLVGDKFIFVVLDFPRKTPQDQKTTQQNRDLQKKYSVKGFPTVIILDEQQQKMGSTGYKPGGAKPYADMLLKIVNDFKQFRQQVSSLSEQNLSEKELQALYSKACELCLSDDAHHIVKMGMQLQNNRFFLLERFHTLANNGQIHHAEAQLIRQKLLAQDPLNEQKTHYDVAVIEFEAFSSEMEKEQYAPEIAVAPLVAYIDHYGDADPEHLWQLHMIISQVFLEKNKTQEALKHAKASHATAPLPAQSEILTFIHNIQSTH